MASVLGGLEAEVLSDAEARTLGFETIVHNGEIDPDNSLVESLLRGGEVPAVDKVGRPIISYKQFVEIQSAGGRLDAYALRVKLPGYAGQWLIQASKYIKWFGLGYEAVGIPVLETHAAGALRYRLEQELIGSLDFDDDANENQTRRRAEQAVRKARKAIDSEIVQRIEGVETARRNVHLERTGEVVRRATAAAAPADVTIYFCKDKYPDCARFFDTDRGLKWHWRKDHGESPIKRPKDAVPGE